MRLVSRVRRFAAHQIWRLGYVPADLDSPDIHLDRYWRALAGLAFRKPDFFFVQVGANDGVSFDWLFETVVQTNARGIVIEPVQEYFDELVKNYRPVANVRPVRAALHSSDREATIYRVAQDATINAEWRKGIASLDPNHHLRSGTPSGSIVEERVPCMSWRELMESHGVDRIDYLQVDAEGYDGPIMRMVLADLDRWKPSLIRFEHWRPDGVMSRDELASLVGEFALAGYQIVVGETDAYLHLRQWPSD